MATNNYQASFNSGELSRKMDGRSDLDVYRNGCRLLQNFYVMPQGGVERRTGTEFVDFTNEDDGAEGDTSARMIPFVFSSDVAYALEFGDGYIKAWSTDPVTGVNTAVDITGTIPYAEADVREIQYVQRFDTLILTHPNHATQSLTRNTLTPTFSIVETAFDYPPLLEENDTAITITPSSKVVGATDLDASAGLFVQGHVGSTWRISHERSDAQLSKTNAGWNSTQTSVTPFDVSYSNWRLVTSGNWKGLVIILRSVDGGDFERYVVIGDSTNTTEQNFSFDSPTKEGANTQLKVYLNWDAGTNFFFNLSTDNPNWDGLVEILTVLGSGVPITGASLASNVVTITAVAHGLANNDLVSISNVGFATTNPNISTGVITVTGVDSFTYALTGGNETYTTDSTSVILNSSAATANVISELGDTAATTLWAEGSFSTFRGFPAAASWHQDRLWFAGTTFEPATLYGSVSGDYYNFITGTEDDLSIKRIIDSPEESKWLLSKRFLFLGTAGSSVTAKSADNNSLITAGNIDTNSQSVYGSAPIQALLANDVVLYVQKNGLKVREMLYNWEEENYKSNDITILSEEITESGIVETFLQKQPDQNFWAIKENGDIGLLTYERGQEVVGWSRVETDGEVISGCAIPNESGEDQVWICVKRLGKYLVERFHPRADLDWYVDSAVEYDGGVCQTATSITVGADPDYKITVNLVGHGRSTAELIRFENVVGMEYLNGRTFYINKLNDDSFDLKTIDGTEFISAYIIDLPESILVNGSTTMFLEDDMFEGRWAWRDLTLSFTTRYKSSVPSWTINTGVPDVIVSSDLMPPKAGYSGGGTVSYWDGITGDFCLVQNTLSGLGHLEGETVQVVVDGNYHSDQLIAGGLITLNVYGNTILAGLQYVSKLQPMPIEPATGEMRSQSRKKAVTKVSLLFYKTLGAKVGEPGLLESNFAALKTNDIAGEPLSTFSGEVRVFMANNWERQKVIQIKQDLPYPMTVLSMSVWTKVTGA